MNISFKWVKKDVLPEGRQIRTTVFVDEQDVLPEEEFDGSDKYAENVVMYEDGIPCAAGRIIVGNRGEGMIGRVAVLKEYRGKGYGKILMEELMRRTLEKGFDTVYVHAQMRAKGFYESLGFQAYGEIFMDANIPHISMKKVLHTPTEII